MTAPSGAAAVQLRAATIGDLDFLQQMLGEAARAPGSPWPSVGAGLADRRLARFLPGWPRPGDLGVLALADARPIGAAWLRRFAGGDLLAGEEPEVPVAAVAVEPLYRCRGIGRRLVVALIVHAADHGIGAIDATLGTWNGTAVRLYRSAGFAEVEHRGDLVRMRRKVRPPGPRRS